MTDTGGKRLLKLQRKRAKRKLRKARAKHSRLQYQFQFNRIGLAIELNHRLQKKHEQELSHRRKLTKHRGGFFGGMAGLEIGGILPGGLTPAGSFLARDDAKDLLRRWKELFPATSEFLHGMSVNVPSKEEEEEENTNAQADQGPSQAVKEKIQMGEPCGAQNGEDFSETEDSRGGPRSLNRRELIE